MSELSYGLMQGDDASRFVTKLTHGFEKHDISRPFEEVCGREYLSDDLVARCLIAGCVLIAAKLPTIEKFFEGNIELFELSISITWEISQEDYIFAFDALYIVLKESQYAKEMSEDTGRFMRWGNIVKSLMYHSWNQMEKGELGPILNDSKFSQLRDGDVFAFKVDSTPIIAQSLYMHHCCFWLGEIDDFPSLISRKPLMVASPIGQFFSYAEYVGNFEERYDRSKIDIGVTVRGNRQAAKQNLADRNIVLCSLAEYKGLSKQPPTGVDEVFWQLRSIISDMPYRYYGVTNDPPAYPD